MTHPPHLDRSEIAAREPRPRDAPSRSSTTIATTPLDFQVGVESEPPVRCFTGIQYTLPPSIPYQPMPRTVTTRLRLENRITSQVEIRDTIRLQSNCAISSSYTVRAQSCFQCSRVSPCYRSGRKHRLADFSIRTASEHGHARDATSPHVTLNHTPQTSPFHSMRPQRALAVRRGGAFRIGMHPSRYRTGVALRADRHRCAKPSAR